MLAAYSCRTVFCVSFSSDSLLRCLRKIIKITVMAKVVILCSLRCSGEICSAWCILSHRWLSPHMTGDLGWLQLDHAELPLSQATKSLKEQGVNNTIARTTIESIQVACGLGKVLDGATAQGHLQKGCLNEWMAYLFICAHYREKKRLNKRKNKSLCYFFTPRAFIWSCEIYWPWPWPFSPFTCTCRYERAWAEYLFNFSEVQQQQLPSLCSKKRNRERRRKVERKKKMGRQVGGQADCPGHVGK